MKRLLTGLMLLATAGAAGAEWTRVGEADEFIQYVDKGTIRKSGNLVKMWDLTDFKKVRTIAGKSRLSRKGQVEYDCKEEKSRGLAFTDFSGQMGSGKVVFSDSDPYKWSPIEPGSSGEALFEVACGKK